MLIQIMMSLIVCGSLTSLLINGVNPSDLTIMFLGVSCFFQELVIKKLQQKLKEK